MAELGGISVRLKADVDDSGVAVAAQRIIGNAKKIEDSFKSAGLSAKASTKEFSGALDTTKTALKAFIQQQIAAGRSIDENGNVITAYGVKAKALTDTFKALSQEYENNRRIANKTADAMSAIELNIRSLDAAAESTSEDVRVLSQEIAKTSRQSGDFVGPIQKVETASNKATKAFKFQKGGLAQLGQQIQDVSVMAQYGADKFVILGTQGSQIASLFGPGGALFGAVIAISAAIGGTLVKSIDAANEAGKQLPTELGKRLEDIKARYEEVDDASRAAFTRVEFGKLNQEYDSLQQRIDNIQQAAFEQAQAINSSGQEALTAANKIKELKKQQEDLATLMERVSQLSTEDLATQGIDLSIDGGDAGVQSRIDSIRDGIERERELYEAWRQTRAGITAGIISDEQAQAINADIAAQQRIEQNFDQLKQRLEDERTLTLENQTLTAEEKAEKQKEIDQAILDAEASKDEQLLQQNQMFQDEMNRIEEDASNKRLRIAEKEHREKMQGWSNALTNLSNLMNTESRKMFEVGKTAAIAGAIVDGIAAVQGAFKVGNKIGGPPVGAAFAAAAAAGSLANIQKISNTQYGSAGAGQSYQGGQVVNNVSQPQEQTLRREIDLNFTGASVTDPRALAEILNEAAGDGVQFNINNG